MTMDEYNQARAKVIKLHEKVLLEPSESNVAEFYLAVAIQGLVIMPMDHLEPGEIPTPICGFISLPADQSKEPSSIPVMHYIFPADQHKS